MPSAHHLLVTILCLLLAQTTARAQQTFQTLSDASEPTIAGRPVQLDPQGNLLPWPLPNNTGYSYSADFLSQWEILKDQLTRTQLPYFYCCFDFDRTTFEATPDKSWANSTGYLRGMMEGFVERLYPYTADPSTIAALQSFVDFELLHGRTPAEYAWSLVPYPSANPGAKRYTGWSQHGEDYIEPHVVGADGYAYLRLYEITAEPRYLHAAILCAGALAKNYRPGTATRSPWPYRVYAQDGTEGTGEVRGYSANVVEPIMLFDELIRIHHGDTARYRIVRAAAWQWLRTFPMRNNVWSGYFEDVDPNIQNMNQVIPLELARYLLLHPEKDPTWRQDAARLIAWVKTTPKWPKYTVHGALITTEQGDGHTFCCNLPGQCCDSHTARLAAVEAFYAFRTGDAASRDAAFRSFNWVTYFQGLPGKAHAPFSNQWWFTDEFTDGPRRLMDAFWAFPEWAPADEAHLLGSTSVVTRITYAATAITYSTFDPHSDDVLRLNFTPSSITIGGRPIPRTKTPTKDGYTFDPNTKVLRIHRLTSRDVVIHSQTPDAHLNYIRFDNPHLPAGTILPASYPSTLIEWSPTTWKIHVPEGKFGTFNLTLADPSNHEATFTFTTPTLFAGIDAYNAASTPTTIHLTSPSHPDRTFTLQPGELQQLRTAWQTPTALIHFSIENPTGVLFDNLAYTAPDDVAGPPQASHPRKPAQ